MEETFEDIIRGEPTKTRKIAEEPWHASKELELLERPGIQHVTLLTDECGCLLLAQGILPEYLRRQAEDALSWLATDERGLARRALDSERRRTQKPAPATNAVARPVGDNQC